LGAGGATARAALTAFGAGFGAGSSYSENQSLVGIQAFMKDAVDIARILIS